MARSKINPATSVTFRMPDENLNKIDELALKNSHHITSGINYAYRNWIKISGVFGKEILNSSEHTTKCQSPTENK